MWVRYCPGTWESVKMKRHGLSLPLRRSLSGMGVKAQTKK